MHRIVPRSPGPLTVVLAVFSVVCAGAQTPIVEEPGYKPTLTFDVVVIRPSPPPDANFHVSVVSPPHSSRFEATNLPLKSLIQVVVDHLTKPTEN